MTDELHDFNGLMLFDCVRVNPLLFICMLKYVNITLREA